MEPTCDATLVIEQNDDNWLLACVQEPEHKGPHVGLIGWNNPEGE